MTIDLEAIPSEAIEAAHAPIRALGVPIHHDLIAECVAAAAPLLRAPLVAEVERLRAIVGDGAA